MTLIVGLHGKDAIVVASDSRAYFKDEKKVTCHDDNSKKIYIVRNVAICGAGAVSGVPQYARCLLDLLYSENMETEVLERLAAYVITKTKTQNDEVGGRVQMVTITPVGAIRLEDEKINSIILENEDRAKKLKEIFIL